MRTQTASSIRAASVVVCRCNRPATIKDSAGKMLGFGQAMSGMFVGDEVLKGSIASYAFEAMEIASYRVLVSTARQVGDEDTARVCEQILQEEEAMADWLQQNIPALAQQYLMREETPGATATATPR